MLKKIFSQKTLFPLLTISLLLNLFLVLKIFGVLETSPSQNSLKRRVSRVIDGDTFDTDQEERIRLKGAQAPEWPEGCLAQEAKQRLEGLILGQEVLLQEIEKDNFGRLVAFVFVSDLFVDQALVEEGLAQASSGENPQYGAQLLSAQDSAQKAQRGLWSSLCSPKNPDCNIKGNVRRDKGTKIYHLPECFNYQKIVINEKEGDQWLCSESQAQAAGFTISLDCP